MNKKLSMKQILCYGSGAVTGNVYVQFVQLFLLVFFTDMLGLDPTLAGILYAAVGWLGVISDLVVGYLSDKTGKYKLWMFWGVVVAGAIFVLMFYKFDMPASATVWYAFISYLAWNSAYSAYTISYNAMSSALTTDGETRTLLNAARFALLAIPSIAISVATPYLTGNHDDPIFYTIGALVFALLGVAFIIPTMIGIKEPQVVSNKEKLNIKDAVRSLLGNKQLLLIALSYAMYALGFDVYYATMTYFFRYNYISPTMMSWVLIMNAPLSFFVSLVVPPLCKKLGKMGTFNFGGISFIAAVGLIFLFPNSGPAIFIGNIVALFALNLMSPVITIQMADAIDYGVWQTGKNVRAVSFAAISMLGKIADGSAGLVIGATVAAFGYIANQPQTARAQLGINITYCIIPIVIFVVLLAVMNMFWKLNESKMAEVAAELDARAKEDGLSV